MKNKGFTLIELLVVVAIIGILAAVVAVAAAVAAAETHRRDCRDHPTRGRTSKRRRLLKETTSLSLHLREIYFSSSTGGRPCR